MWDVKGLVAKTCSRVDDAVGSRYQRFGDGKVYSWQVCKHVCRSRVAVANLPEHLRRRELSKDGKWAREFPEMHCKPKGKSATLGSLAVRLLRGHSREPS